MSVRFSAMKTLKSTKGFTLIEALIVVIIVGLLAGVGIVKLGAAKTEAQIAVKKAAAAEINKGIQRAIVYNNGAGYTLDTVAATRTAADIVDGLVLAGHFTAASGAAMKEAIANGTALTVIDPGPVAAGASTVTLLAAGGVEVRP